MSGFVLHPGVLTDLDAIWEFIAADNLAAAIESSPTSSKPFTLSSPSLKWCTADLNSHLTRCAFIPVRDFIIAYAPDEKPLLVLAVLHSRRNPRVLAALLCER